MSDSTTTAPATPTGMLSRIGGALHAPSASLTWTQLAAATVFVLVVIFAWRQVTKLIMNELYR